MSSFRTGDYLVYLLRPGQSFQAWWAWHQYLQGLRRAYARHGAGDLAVVHTQPAVFAAGYRLEPSPGGRSQVLVGGMRCDVRTTAIDHGGVYISPGSPVGWFQGGWSEDRDFTPILGRCWQHLLDELGLDEGYGIASGHALRAWGYGGAEPISDEAPGPLHYTSHLLRVRTQIMPTDQWATYARECRQLGGLSWPEAA